MHAWSTYMVNDSICIKINKVRSNFVDKYVVNAIMAEWIVEACMGKSFYGFVVFFVCREHKSDWTGHGCLHFLKAFYKVIGTWDK